ncbi:MAG: putative toxin-antitoxin system toxin component, PIN family [Deltaproteobacteria bacterium]|jgi:putative PIN family toxin of toxin-antitoxin system|nr:putative toxin-antitoxin system toxin component, PIN family [Deltaproteobacteria bacterium]
MRILRVVLDTNCLVSALLFNNARLSPLREYWKAGKFIPLACKKTAEELIRVLAYPKFQLTGDEIKELLGEILPFLEIHELEGEHTAIESLRDDSDAVFIHLALQSKADFFVSGDADILALRNSISGPTIIKPADFLLSLKSGTGAAQNSA